MKIYNFLNIITGYGKRFNIGKLEKNRKVPWKKHSGCAGRGAGLPKAANQETGDVSRASHRFRKRGAAAQIVRDSKGKA